MKRIVLLFPLLGLLFLFSCEKMDSPTVASSDMVRNTEDDLFNDLTNDDNPYDIHGITLEEVYGDIEDLLSRENLSLSEFELGLDSVLSNSNGIYYPAIDTVGYSVAESVYFYEFLSGVTIENLVDRSRLFEDSLVLNSSFNDVQKNRLFSLISQFKYNYYFGNKISDNLSRKPKLTACLDSNLGDIFYSDNPIDAIQFVVGIPISFVWEVAKCAYEISR